MPEPLDIIDKYYLSPSRLALRDLLLTHSRMVAEKALAIASRKNLPLDAEEITSAALLHDIGIFRCNAPSILCHGTEPYIRHGIIGAEILRSEGVPEKFARVAERHTGAGITAEEVVAQGLPLEPRDYCPETLLERLICYADKFFSKSGDPTDEKTLDRVARAAAAFGPASAARFAELQATFE